MPPDAPVILFDGVCNLCDASVQFVIDHDRTARYRFAPLQSDTARQLVGARAAALDSIVLVEDGRVYDRSTAALRIARHLDGPWPLLAAFLGVPRPIRDVVYDWIARNRYRWFGTRDACRLPTPDTAARFLETTPA